MASYPLVSDPNYQNPGPPGGYGTNVITGSAPGLDQLSNVETISIRQKGVCCCCQCWPANCKYKVKSEEDLLLYRVEEDTNCLIRLLCNVVRPFDIRVTDSHKTEVMTFKRSLGCGLCLLSCGNWYYPCLLQEMEVCWPPGQLLGRIKQNYSPCTPSLTGLDAFGQPKFHVSGGFCRFPCFVDIKFTILSSDNQTKVGSITKKWTNYCKESCTNAHHFEVRFPKNVDVRDKALVLAAAILIDYMHFT